jgi:hypothetical protein
MKSTEQQMWTQVFGLPWRFTRADSDFHRKRKKILRNKLKTFSLTEVYINPLYGDHPIVTTEGVTEELNFESFKLQVEPTNWTVTIAFDCLDSLLLFSFFMS